MIRVGLVGYGYWGPNLLRNFMVVDGIEPVAVCDRDPERLDLAQTRCPGVRALTDSTALSQADDVDAVAIATPVHTHHALATQALAAGKHVLLEKPMAHSVEACHDLQQEAARQGVVLLVDHTFLYTPAVTKIRELVEAGELGDLYYVDSVRINLGLFQHDINVIWDLAPHDLSIAAFVLGRPARSVVAVGACHAGSQVEDVAHLTVDYGGNLLANFHVNWLSPVKVRQMIVGGSQKSIIFNDLDPVEKLRVYDRGVDIPSQGLSGKHDALIRYRWGDTWSPALPIREALRTEVEHFVRCITEGETPVSGAAEGLAVVRILEAAQTSLAQHGARVTL